MIVRIASLLLVMAAFALTTPGCMPASEAGTTDRAHPRVGEQCTVQFRRDALGAATELPISPLTNSTNGAETSVSGTLVSADDRWVVLDRGDGDELWIPTSNVLLLRLRIQKSTS